MGKLIKMDFYRLFQSKTFWISAAVMFFLQGITSFSMPILQKNLLKFASVPAENASEMLDTKLSEIFSSPMMSFFMLIMFISATTFLFADIRDGYVKNFVGQIARKGYSAISKFIVVCVHNAFFMLLALSGNILGVLLCPDSSLIVDSAVGSGIVVFFVELLLSFAMTSIILFLTTGLRNKTLASVVGVLFSVSALGLLYMALNQLLSMVGIKNFDVSNYAPDRLFNSQFDTAAIGAVINAIIVSVVFIGVFVGLTVAIFNKRDVK